MKLSSGSRSRSADQGVYESSIDPMYSNGVYVRESSGYKDAAYKVDQLIRLPARNENLFHEGGVPQTVADVGCGSGRTTFLLGERLTSLRGVSPLVDGCDVHSDLPESAEGGPSFISGDFCVAARRVYDMVVLFDVMEHVPGPAEFLAAAGRFARLVALHIPLDDSLFGWLRGLPSHKLEFPGHLLVLNPSTAMNLLAIAGLRVVDFRYSPVFRAPSGWQTMRQRMLYPVRAVAYALSPYMTQRLLGGVSLVVLAKTRLGLEERC